jgi:molybdopterin converting factor small subunit
MITVEVRFHGGLQRYAPGRDKAVRGELQTGATLLQLLEHLNLPAGQAKTVFVNDRLQPLNSVLPDGARVSIFPALAGG